MFFALTEQRGPLVEEYRKLLSEKSFHSHLYEIDLKLATEGKSGRCPVCGGQLNWANFSRKPRGVSGTVRAFYMKRFALCCACDGCRKRVTPFSMRFLGRKQHVSPVLVVYSAMLQRVRGGRLRKLAARLGVSTELAEHWKTWWSALRRTAFWIRVRGVLPATFKQNDLPRGLLLVFKGSAREQLTSLLRLLLPLTSQTAPDSQAT